MPKRRNLRQELALALQVAALCNRDGVPWADPSPFQDTINRLLVECGREPVFRCHRQAERRRLTRKRGERSDTIDLNSRQV